MWLSVPVFLFFVASITALSWLCQPECYQGIWCPVVNVWDGMCVGVWLIPIPVVIPPVQAGWVAPNQCLEKRMMADGWRNSVLHPLCFLNTKQIWSKWSFCELGVSLFLMPAVLYLLMVLLPFRETVAMQTACSMQFFGSLTLGKQAGVDSNSFLAEELFFFKAISFLQTVPDILLCAKRPSSHTVQNLLFGFGSYVLSINSLTLGSDSVQSCGKSLEMWVLTYRIHWQQVP